MTSLSFDRFISLYDSTRTFSAEAMNGALNELSKLLPVNQYAKCLEPGIGNGRIAFNLARMGYEVTGIDISTNMIRDLNRKSKNMSGNTFKKLALGDVTKIPFMSDSFDFAIAVHLFYFIPNWKEAIHELIRAIKPKGNLIFLHTGTGQEIPALNQQYKNLCGEYGFEIKGNGVSSTSEVIQYLNEIGLSCQEIKDKWKWNENIELKSAIRDLEKRAYSFTGSTPADVHKKAIKALAKECKLAYGNLSQSIKVPCEIKIVNIEIAK